MKRRMRMIIEVDVIDLDEETRAELEEDEALMNEDLDEEELGIPNLTHYLSDSGRNEIGWLVANFLEPDVCNEIFAGSNVFVTFENGQLVRSEWIGELEESN